MNDKSILITGGTGSFGRKFVEVVLERYSPARVIVFSRDELKQSEMRCVFPGNGTLMRYFIGDVRDYRRLRRAMAGVDIVVHAAALKQVPSCEYNPIEAVMTNVMGARNVIDAALDTGVGKVIALSSDKAVNPVNLYGATKLVAEKLFIHGNVYSGYNAPRFSVVRYGNVIGSRGSVVPLFLQQRKTGTVTVTDKRMTRFWVTLEQGVDFVLRCIDEMQGGEVFVPRLPSMGIMDLVTAVAPDCNVKFTGIRAGEKLHEVLISTEEARSTVRRDDMFVVGSTDGEPLSDGFSYTSDGNDWKLTAEELREMVRL